MKKKSILFVNESLTCAGGEKSLLNLLSSIDYDSYDIYLQLFQYGCEWDKLVDRRCKILPPLPYCAFVNMRYGKAIFYAVRHWKLNWLWSRIKFSCELRNKRKNQGNVSRSCLYWKTQCNCFDLIKMSYDYIIAYAQGIPTFYVSDKAPSESKKLSWINVTYTPDQPWARYIENKYKNIDVINCVSEEIKSIEGMHWNTLIPKLRVWRDPINPDMILNLAQEPISIKKESRLILVTLGRLVPQKGYDIALNAAKILKDNHLDFIWYILGKGPLEPELKDYVKQMELEDCVKFLGVKPNPYPYLNIADIYVQTSRHEGFGLAIAEARLLNIPVVTTRFNTVYMQMIDRANGLIADMDGTSVAEAILELNSDKQLYKSIKEYLKNEKKGNLEIISDFYRLLES